MKRAIMFIIASWFCHHADENEPTPWPTEKEIDDYEEKVDNYVKPLEVDKPPTLIDAPKRKRGRPKKTVGYSPVS